MISLHTLEIYVRRTCAGRVSEEDQRDIVGIAYLKLLQNPHDQTKSQFRSWVISVVKYAILEWFRSRNMQCGGSRRDSTVREVLVEPEKLELAVCEVNDIQNFEIMECLRLALQDYPEGCIQTLNGLLRGDSMAQVAEELGISESSVMNRKRDIQECLSTIYRLLNSA